MFDKKTLEESLRILDSQASILIKDEADVTKELVFESKDGSAEELKLTPVVYFKNCTNGTYTINRRSKNVFIENCSNCTFHLNQVVLTRTAEIWHGANNTVHIASDLKTLQVDMVSGLNVLYANWKHFHAIIHNQLENLSLTFTNSPEHNIVTGHTHMLTEFPDSNVTDQFIIRFVNGVLLPERCVRLRNGHLSTEREAIEWERRNERTRTDYTQKFMKDAGIQLNRVDTAPKVGNNEPCPCGSGRKYKKCCQGKKEVQGLADSERKISYKN